MTSSIAALHVAKKQLGLDDDTYRAKLARITGKSSAKDMSEPERQAVLSVLRNEGFSLSTASGRHGSRRKLTGKYAPKLQALWIAGFNLGVIDDREDSAMIAFIRRQTGVDDTRFLHHADDARRAIEGLKAWLHREAGVDWSDKKSLPPYAAAHGYRIAQAQWRMFGGAAADFWSVVKDILDEDRATRDLSAHQWITVMNYFGERIRSSREATP
ncbi:gp16 family protein [Rhizobium halophytocola]|uniref:Phage gp16-like protein n=1 Tax=Rhizobium halophytocola TaxID=735519 RepID=A0ABS4E467_9HYPH|nr:regulatory protein GemA [Rhizobium halophytocola]MBP1852707.1 phage gp16-like protein [Rhizobium halophytocola]